MRQPWSSHITSFHKDQCCMQRPKGFVESTLQLNRGVRADELVIHRRWTCRCTEPIPRWVWTFNVSSRRLFCHNAKYSCGAVGSRYIGLMSRVLRWAYHRQSHRFTVGATRRLMTTFNLSVYAHINNSTGGDNSTRKKLIRRYIVHIDYHYGIACAPTLSIVDLTISTLHCSRSWLDGF